MNARPRNPQSQINKTRAESRATTSAVFVFALGLVVAGITLSGGRHGLGGQDSLGSHAAAIGALGAAVSFVFAFVREARLVDGGWRRHMPRTLRAIDAAVMALAVASLSYLTAIAAGNLFQLGFIGLTVDPWGGAAIVAGVAAALSYAASLFGARVTTEGLASLATLVIFMGTMASMLTSPDEAWWQFHFSQLGNGSETSAEAFNLTLILAGLVAMVLASYFAHEAVTGLQRRGIEPGRMRRNLTIHFALVGALLSMAGIVTDASSFVIHVGSATGMVVVFGFYVIRVTRTLPGLSWEFRGFSFVVLAGIITAVLLWTPIGYYNLTGAETVIASLMFAWLLVYARTATAYALGDDAAAAPDDVAATRSDAGA